MWPFCSILVVFLLSNSCGASDLKNIDPSDCEFTEDIFKSVKNKSWNYQDLSTWDDICMVGKFQSPLDLPRSTVEIRELGNLTFHNYASSPLAQRMLNTGHSVMIDVCDVASRLPRISDGGLNGTYVFHQMHFHWSDSDWLGSEHSKSGTFFPLEVQLIHYKEVLGSIEKAMKEPEGLAIISILFQLNVEKNTKLSYFLPFIDNITVAETEVILEVPFPLLNLLPVSLNRYYRYSGSLTAPPCTENVIWTIFRLPVPILLKQLSQFRQLYGPPDKSTRFLFSHILRENVRPLINLSPDSTRQVFANSASIPYGRSLVQVVLAFTVISLIKL